MSAELHILIETCIGTNHKTVEVIAVGDFLHLLLLKEGLESTNIDNETKIKDIREYYNQYNDKFNNVRDEWIGKIKDYKFANPIALPEHFAFQDDGCIEYGFNVLLFKHIRCLDKITFEIQTVKPSHCLMIRDLLFQSGKINHEN